MVIPSPGTVDASRWGTVIGDEYCTGDSYLLRPPKRPRQLPEPLFRDPQSCRLHPHERDHPLVALGRLPPSSSSHHGSRPWLTSSEQVSVIAGQLHLDPTPRPRYGPRFSKVIDMHRIPDRLVRIGGRLRRNTTEHKVREAKTPEMTAATTPERQPHTPAQEWAMPIQIVVAYSAPRSSVCRHEML